MPPDEPQLSGTMWLSPCRRISTASLNRTDRGYGASGQYAFRRPLCTSGQNCNQPEVARQASAENLAEQSRLIGAVDEVLQHVILRSARRCDGERGALRANDGEEAV